MMMMMMTTIRGIYGLLYPSDIDNNNLHRYLFYYLNNKDKLVTTMVSWGDYVSTSIVRRRQLCIFNIND